jgi:hypothetical protein
MLSPDQITIRKLLKLDKTTSYQELLKKISPVLTHNLIYSKKDFCKNPNEEELELSFYLQSSLMLNIYFDLDLNIKRIQRVGYENRDDLSLIGTKLLINNKDAEDFKVRNGVFPRANLPRRSGLCGFIKDERYQELKKEYFNKFPIDLQAGNSASAQLFSDCCQKYFKNIKTFSISNSDINKSEATNYSVNFEIGRKNLNLSLSKSIGYELHIQVVEKNNEANSISLNDEEYDPLNGLQIIEDILADKNTNSIKAIKLVKALSSTYFCIDSENGDEVILKGRYKTNVNCETSRPPKDEILYTINFKTNSIKCSNNTHSLITKEIKRLKALLKYLK